LYAAAELAPGKEIGNVCRDVTGTQGGDGTNGVNGAPGYKVGPGWDAATGLGSINGTQLLKALSPVQNYM